MILITNLPDQSAVTFLVSQLTLPVFNIVSIVLGIRTNLPTFFVVVSCQFEDAKDMIKMNSKLIHYMDDHTTSSAGSIPSSAMTNYKEVHLALGAQS